MLVTFHSIHKLTKIFPEEVSVSKCNQLNLSLSQVWPRTTTWLWLVIRMYRTLFEMLHIPKHCCQRKCGNSMWRWWICLRMPSWRDRRNLSSLQTKLEFKQQYLAPIRHLEEMDLVSLLRKVVSGRSSLADLKSDPAEIKQMVALRTAFLCRSN